MSWTALIYKPEVGEFSSPQSKILEEVSWTTRYYTDLEGVSWTPLFYKSAVSDLNIPSLQIFNM